MKIIDILNNRKNNETLLSIELVPPRNGGNIKQVYKTIEAVQEFDISFVSVTYGSGGSLRGGTPAIAALIQEKYGLDSIAHLTCVNATKEDIENVLMLFKYLGIKNILALRGDPPWGEKNFKHRPGGHKYASDLINQIVELNKGKYLLRTNDKKFFNLPDSATYREGEPTDFCIGGAVYPEGHSETPDIQQDIENLKIKINAGAEYLITQMIFDDKILDGYLKKLSEENINIPVIPGIMPLTSYSQAKTMEKMFHVNIDDFLLNELKKYQDDQSKSRQASIEFTVDLCNKLKKINVPCIHFYTLNRGELIAEVLEKLV